MVVPVSPIERDRRMGILHPASLKLMELDLGDLGAMVRQVAHLGLLVEPENLRQVFVAHLEARVAKRYCLWPTKEDFALIKAPERLEALCEDFLASEEGQWLIRRLREAIRRTRRPPCPRRSCTEPGRGRPRSNPCGPLRAPRNVPQPEAPRG